MTKLLAWFRLRKVKRALKFVGTGLSKGALHAMGGIIVYMLALWLVLSNFFPKLNDKLVNDAIRSRSPALSRMVDREGNQIFH